MARPTSPFHVLGLQFLIFNPEGNLERVYDCVRGRLRKERRNAAVRAHCRLAIHYAKRLNDRNICILAHRDCGETLRRALWALRVSSRRTLIRVIRRAATTCSYTASLARDSRFGCLERASRYGAILSRVKLDLCY